MKRLAPPAWCAVVALSLPLPLALFAACASTPLRTVGGDGGATSCAAQTSAGQAVVGDAIKAAAADVSCTTDDDCSLVNNAAVCTAGCGVLVNRAGAARVKAAVDSVNATTCATFERDGCFIATSPCAPPLGGAACVASACAMFPPAVWGSLAVERAPAGSGLSSPPSCDPASSACSLWLLTPDAHVVVTTQAGTATKTLSAPDFATIDGILRGTAFRQGEMTGFHCPAAPSPAARVAFHVRRALGTTGLDVSGCALGAPTTAPESDVRRIYDVISAY